MRFASIFRYAFALAYLYLLYRSLDTAWRLGLQSCLLAWPSRFILFFPICIWLALRVIGMVKQLNQMGIQLMVSVWPLVDQGSTNFNTMNQDNYFIQCPAAHNQCHNSEYPLFWIIIFRSLSLSVGIYIYDPTIPAARQYVWDQVVKGYFNYGIKVWWLDADEPEQFNGT